MKNKVTFTAAELEELAGDIFMSFPEYTSGYCLKLKMIRHSTMDYIFFDSEDDDQSEYVLNKEKILIGLQKFLDAHQDGKLPGIPLSDLKDAGEYDATAAQAVVEFCIFGELTFC